MKERLLASAICFIEEWLFNIADFVDYYLDIDNNESKLVQIRFYPR